MRDDTVSAEVQGALLLLRHWQRQEEAALAVLFEVRTKVSMARSAYLDALGEQDQQQQAIGQRLGGLLAQTNGGAA